MTQNYKPAYPAEFRHQMVELVALGRCPKQLSKEFGCHYTSIQAWCRATGVRYRPQATATTFASSGAPLNSNERQELLDLLSCYHFFLQLRYFLLTDRPATLNHVIATFSNRLLERVIIALE